MLQPMGLQRVRHNLVTEQECTINNLINYINYQCLYVVKCSVAASCYCYFYNYDYQWR